MDGGGRRRVRDREVRFGRRESGEMEWEEERECGNGVGRVKFVWRDSQNC